jgi:hypothetical protein
VGWRKLKPIETRAEIASFQRLKRKCDTGIVSNLAFDFNECRYRTGRWATSSVGRCKLKPAQPMLQVPDFNT